MTEPNKGYWLESEHHRFLEAMLLYGTKWKEVQKYIGTRNVKQAKSHSQKYFNNLTRNFLRDTNKDPSYADYLLTWTLNYLQESYFPLIQIKNFDNLDFTKLYDRIVRIFTSKIKVKRAEKDKRLHFKKSEQKKSSCCCKRLRNRICDCLFDCCKEDYKVTEVPQYGKPKQIFKIEKILKSSGKISTLNKILILNGKHFNNKSNSCKINHQQKVPNENTNFQDIHQNENQSLSFHQSPDKIFLNVFSTPSYQYVSDSKSEENFFFFGNKSDDINYESIDYMNLFSSFQN
jgi:SHAQKYF class myb-like DNA-binding protein